MSKILFPSGASISFAPTKGPPLQSALQDYVDGLAPDWVTDWLDYWPQPSIYALALEQYYDRRRIEYLRANPIAIPERLRSQVNVAIDKE